MEFDQRYGLFRAWAVAYRCSNNKIRLIYFVLEALEMTVSREFYRIEQLPPYVFEEINRLRDEARAKGADIVDLGMGNPDLPPPSFITDALVEAISAPCAHRYSVSRGIFDLRRAQAAYYERRFGVRLDPDRQVISTLGIKEGIANLAQAIVAPGDVILAPNPAYPIHRFGFLLSGGSIRDLPARADDDFMRRLDAEVRGPGPKPVAVVLNFPSNPTACVADPAFYAEIVRYARANDLFIISDLAYAEIYFDGNRPSSVLQIDGAMDVTIEFTSLSKTFSMPGWRMGFAVGNERLVGALTRIKSYLDYGSFAPIQIASAAALDAPDSDVVIDGIRSVYQRRRDILTQSFSDAGWPIPAPPATMFAWAPLPEAFRNMGSLAFSKLLIAEAKLTVAPGVCFGDHGEGFVRIALVEDEERIRQAADGVRQLLGSCSDSPHTLSRS